MPSPEIGGQKTPQREISPTPSLKEKGGGLVGFRFPIPRHDRFTTATAGGPDITSIGQGLAQKQEGGTTFQAVHAGTRPAEWGGVTTLEPEEATTPAAEPTEKKSVIKKMAHAVFNTWPGRVLLLPALTAAGITVQDMIQYHEVPPTPQGWVQTGKSDINAIIGIFGFTAVEVPPIVVQEQVPPTFTKTTDTKALDHATGADGTPLDQLPVTTRVTASETLFQATANGIPVSPDQLSSLLKDAVKPYNNESGGADVKMLFLVKNPGEQKITIKDIAIAAKGYNALDAQGNLKQNISIAWEKEITIPNKDSILIMPLDGTLNNAEIFRVAPYKNLNNGQSYMNKVVIRFRGPDQKKYYLFIDNIGFVQTISSDSILPALADAPEIGKNGTVYLPDLNANVHGKPLPAGTEILKTLHNNGKLSLGLVVDNMAQGGDGHADFDFLASLQEKLLYSHGNQ